MMRTPAGELFYTRAKLALAELALGAAEVAELSGGPSPRVVVGALPDALNPVLPEAVARRIGAARRGDAGITLRGGWFDQLSDQARVGDVDFFVSAVPEGGLPDGLTMEVLYYDDLVMVTRLGHPLAERAQLTLADLAAFHWVVPTKGTALDQLLRKAFQAEGLAAPDSWSEVNPIGSLRAVVSQSDVVVATGRLRVRDELSRGLFRELPLRLPAAHHAVGVFYRSRGALSRPARQLLAALRDVAREYAADDGGVTAKPRG
jgi:LysR family transcriptional regulator of gallate degradation